MSPRWRAAVIVVLAVGTLAVVWVAVGPTRLRPAPDFTGVPPERCDYLHGVVEPITMTDGVEWDDGGSDGLAFKDATGREYAVCLLDTMADERNLTLGSITGDGRKVPVGSVEERAFLGLLQRWAARNPAAKAWETRLDERRRSGASVFRGGETEAQFGEFYGIVIMRQLSARN